MQTLTVTKTIKAPIDVVFEAFTDHEQLSQVFGVRRCVLVRQGDSEKNGLGAIRELDCGAIWLREEITAFERPRRMAYRIVDSRPAADHEFGEVEFSQTARGTRILWRTRFGNRLPFGRLADPALAVLFGVAFRLVLRNVERRVRASGRR